MKSNLSLAILVFAAVFFCSPPVFGQSQVEDKYFSPTSSLKLGDLSLHKGLSAAMDNWLKLVNKGDQLGAFNVSNRILDIMKQLGTRNLIYISDMCVSVGLSALDRMDFDAAVIAGKHAIKFAPDHPDAYFLLSMAYFAKNKTDIKNIASNLILGVKAIFANKILRDSLLSSSIKYVFLAVLLAFIIIFTTMFIRHYRSLLADIAAFLPSRPTGIWRVILGGLVILVPLAIGGWFLFLLAIPLFLWPYLRFGGKAVIAIFALFIFSSPYVFNYMASGVVLANADTYRALYLLSNDTWDYDTKKTLDREILKNPDSKLISFALGLLNRMRKDKTASIRFYDTILDKNPNNLRALVNKGNMYFVAKEYERAAEIYKKAISLHPKSVEAHFNLSNTYVEMFKTNDSEKEYRIAVTTDKKRTSAFVEQARRNPDKKVVDFPITRGDLASFESALAQETGEVSKVLWNIYFGAISIGVYRNMAAGFLLLIVFSHLFWSKAISHKTCPTCGASFLPPVHLSANDSRCNQCVAAKSLKKAVSTSKKDKKQKEIRLYSEQIASRASLLDRLLPGVGSAFFQSNVKALIFTFITCLAIVYGLSTVISDIVTYKIPVKEAAKANLVFLGIATFYWLLMNTVLKKDFY